MAPTPLAQLEQLAASAGPRAAEIERKRMLIIVNPYATTVSDRLRHLVVYALQGRYDVTAVDTERRGHATELCREAALEGYEVVVAFGGDGTVNEAANGLAAAGLDPAERPALSCLPGGATNVYCKLLGIPGEIVDATEHLLGLADDFRPRQVDLPYVNGRAFTFSAGFGLDATVVRRVDSNPTLKRRLGAYYYTWAAVSSFNAHYLVNPPKVDVEVAGRRLHGVTAVVQNADPYTYFQDRPISLAEGATLDGGTLSGLVLERATPLDVPGILRRAFSPRSRVVEHARVDAFTGVTEVVARSADGRPIPLQVDGDHAGDVTEARFEIEPGGLTVVG